MKRFKTLIILSVFIFFFFSLFTCYDCVAKGITSGLYLCADVVIPSLFPTLCLTSFLSYSGVINVFAKRLERITKRLFNMSGYFFSFFILQYCFIFFYSHFLIINILCINYCFLFKKENL